MEQLKFFSHWLSQRWILIITVFIFVLFKLPHLAYPYYWDESWPYAPAILQMYHHGLSLMPNAVDAELSRGHPLFFHFLAAAWMNIFGGSHVSMHSFALVISVGVLVAVFEAGLRLFNRNVAVLALLLVVSQVVFLVQSSFVLFEMLIALLGFLSLVFYVSHKYIATGICLVALFYTKESGLIIGAVLGCDAIVSLFRPGIAQKEKAGKIISVLVPVVLIGVFFLIQKHIRGWYIFPFYASLVEHSWPAFWYKFRMSCVRDTFYENLKYITFIVLAVLSIVAAIKSRKWRLLQLLLPFVIIYYFVDDMRAGRLLPPVPFFILFCASVVWFVANYGSKYFYEDKKQRSLIALAVIFVILFLFFSTMNFFTYRYLLAALVPLLFVTAIMTDLMIRHISPWAVYPVAIAILIVGYISFKSDNDFGDADPGAFCGIEVQQGVVRFFEEAHAYDSVITTSSFLENQHLVNPATGFRSTPDSFRHLIYDINQKTAFVVIDNIEPDFREPTIRKDSGFHLVYKIQRGKVWAEVYGRR